MPGVKWVKPAPLWDLTNMTDMNTPYLAEFQSDSFLPDFLKTMTESNGPVVLSGPEDTVPQVAGGGGQAPAYKLYQPVHQRYYLVLGSLVCGQYGLPDRAVVRKNGEKTSFVLRRQDSQLGELGWVNVGEKKGWQSLPNPLALLADEERLPLHPVKMPAAAQPQIAVPNNLAKFPECAGRTTYYGYLPVDNREKYLAPAVNVAQSIQDAFTSGSISDPRLDAVATRVLEAWRGMYVDPVTGDPLPSKQVPGADKQQLISLYLILDLGDFLKNTLPTVFDAVVNGSSLSNGSDRKKLFDELQAIKHVKVGHDTVTLADAIKELKDKLGLVNGEGDEPTGVSYNVYSTSTDIVGHPSLPSPGDVSYLKTNPPGLLYTLFQNALNEEKTEKVNQGQAWLTVPGDVAGMIKDEPTAGDVYYLRLVYEYGQGCTVVSDASHTFTFAKFFDPDAPARQIRVELPDITKLRKFKRGVGMQTTPELCALMDRVSAGMLTGGGLAPGLDACGLAMICSFSLPIITLVAFIVMFIFLLLFNFIFWWLPFLKICFPIPKSLRPQ